MVSQPIRWVLAACFISIGALAVAGNGAGASGHRVISHRSSVQATALPPTAVPSPSGTPSITPLPSPTSTPTTLPPSPSPTIPATATPTPTSTPPPSPTPTSTPFPKPTPTSTRVPKPTPRPTVDSKPTPTPTRRLRTGKGRKPSGNAHCGARRRCSSAHSGTPKHRPGSGKAKAGDNKQARAGDHHVSVSVPGVGEPVICSGPKQPVAAPFLSAPYAGYAEIASYFDHDLPDYAVDGKIILTTGLTVTGTPSYGTFPSYWAPSLRQYISYDGHNGYDYDIAYQPVLAAAPGTVVYASWESADPYFGYGQMILIKHALGYETLYGHLSQILVHAGQQVRAGQRIAISGTTGHSTGPHLHFSVYHNCHVLDPYGWSGKGKDPLLAFNGESSTYLWRDGRAPGILNPLPGWPTFSSAAHSGRPLPSLWPNGTSPSVRTSPVSHLLLLQIPTLPQTSADIALSAFQKQLADEQQQVLQTLQVLKEQGAITQITPLPDSGAVRVRGTIPAEELTGLPGVASVTGDRPRDESKALAGFHHSLESVLEAPPGPSFFPPTYLDAQWTWRLSVSAEENGPYVLGFTQPKARVRLTLTHAGQPVAWSDAVGDARGAFVAVLKNRVGQDAPIKSPDLLQVASDGKSTTVDAVPLRVWTNSAANRIDGYAPAWARVQTSATESTGTRAYSANSQAGGPSGSQSTRGNFTARIGWELLPGDAVTARLVEASGNMLFTWSRAPGLEMTEGSPLLGGWSQSGSTVRVDVFAHDHWRAGGSGFAATNGYVQIYLTGRQHVAYQLVAGNRLRLTGQGRTTWLTIPVLSGTLQAGARSFSGYAPPGSRVLGRVWDDFRGTVTGLNTRAMPDGKYGFRLPGRVKPGLSVDVAIRYPGTYVIQGTWAARAIVIHENEGLITGHAALDETLVLHAFGPHGRTIGSAMAVTNPTSGAFQAFVFSRDGVHLQLRAGDSLTISDGQVTSHYSLPRFSVQAGLASLGVSGRTSVTGHALGLLFSASRQVNTMSTAIRRGYFHLEVGPRFRFTPDLHLEVLVGSMLTGVESIDVPLGTPTERAAGIVRLGLVSAVRE